MIPFIGSISFKAIETTILSKLTIQLWPKELNNRCAFFKPKFDLFLKATSVLLKSIFTKAKFKGAKDNCCVVFWLA